MKIERIKRIDKKQKIIIATVAILLVGILGFEIIKSTFATESEKYLANQTIDGISFEKAKLNYDNGISNYKVEVINDNKEEYSLKTIDVIFKDSASKEIITVTGYIGETISPDEKKILDVSVDQEIENLDSIKYVINK